MDPPAAKKRRLAPKEPAQLQTSYPHEPAPQPPHPPLQEVAATAPPPAERHEFESFARHLQDAAMLIYRRSQRAPYTNVSILILKWEDDDSQDQELAALEHLLFERYNYRTERWDIPVLPTASVKLGVRMASFLERQASDHLLIVYYAGHGYVGRDNQLYWASNPSGAAAKLKWNGFRCLFDESPSDMLLLLDTCAAREVPVLSSGGTKQVIAARSAGHPNHENNTRSFTFYLTEAFLRLSAGRPFAAEHLYHEVVLQRQQDILLSSGLTNGTPKGASMTENLPVLQTLHRSKPRGLILAPLSYHLDPQWQAAHNTIDGDLRPGSHLRADNAVDPSAAADFTFSEPRVLVCTTFVGEASPDLSSFNAWFHNGAGIAANIMVEGMFLGPPTMLLISMPMTVWNIVQHDKVCCFLGYINSHNMTHLYEKLVRITAPTKATAKDLEDVRILLEAREMAATTPIMHRHDPSYRDWNHAQLPPVTPTRADGAGRPDSWSLSHHSSLSKYATNATPIAPTEKQDNVEESAEMQEAAEQLKALSHVRHLSDETAPALLPQSALTPDLKQNDSLSHDASEPATNETQDNTPSARPKPRRPLQKVNPKQETRCDLCSHAPFKDSSSLRKHIAAAHTRPFPCAFSFAGCSSTFGSKNEWKRHISSQHLCLTYYKCSACSASEGKGNEFNRKDLFTQHLRRMHAPWAIKKAVTKVDGKLHMDWENHVRDMQTSCLVIRRQPPQRSACPKPNCNNVFEGLTSWDEWTEHVGRHMEKGDAAILGVDRLLAKWALDEGIIERKEDGEYRLTGGVLPGFEKEIKENSAEHLSDGTGRDPDEKTIIAASTVVEQTQDDS